MVNKSESSDALRQQLSSLMDGDLPNAAVADACAQWRNDADARRHWHAYHLIGDVLRSDDLAARPARDTAFLQSLRLRLANEAVPLAPQPQPQPQRQTVRQRARAWVVAPMAVAAGFVAVAGVLVITRVMAPEPAAAVLASAKPASATQAAVLVRDARLDRYLSAHRSQANGAMPGGGAEHRVHIVFEGQ